ncbi:hypothetical protein Csa_022706 [Cucumis sativus]|uniref:Uncharacterized protein n=1 Tax=Cucumis sativus TaxID=3659 RepID=A0A0A0LVD0_CUCSA|nr:hypothetical protein Csa_022706 [Cucumis sativus]
MSEHGLRAKGTEAKCSGSRWEQRNEAARKWASKIGVEQVRISVGRGWSNGHLGMMEERWLSQNLGLSYYLGLYFSD